MNLPRPPLMVITDRRRADRPLPALAAEILAAGCRWLMLREKDLPAAGQARLARELVAVAAPLGARVLVNGAAEAALVAGVGGVHLQAAGDISGWRRRLPAGALIGLSAHGDGDLAAADAAGADYATLSPIFASPGKPGYGPALDTAALGRSTARASLPVLALGGVTAPRVSACLAAGAAGVAVMGAVMTAADPRAAVAALIAALGP